MIEQFYVQKLTGKESELAREKHARIKFLSKAKLIFHFVFFNINLVHLLYKPRQKRDWFFWSYEPVNAFRHHRLEDIFMAIVDESSYRFWCLNHSSDSVLSNKYRWFYGQNVPQLVLRERIFGIYSAQSFRSQAVGVQKSRCSFR